MLLNTNKVLMAPEKSGAVIRAGLDSIYLSIGGATRKRIKYIDLMKNSGNFGGMEKVAQHIAAH